MAFTPWTPADIEAGKPVKEEIFELIKGNQESFNTDIEALKQTSQIDIFNINFTGFISQYNSTEINAVNTAFKAPVGATINSFVITLLGASTSGTLSIDIDKSTDNGANWSTILNNPVDLTGITVGSISGAVDFISAATQEFDQNDFLRLRITGIQVDQGSFQVSCYGEVS